MDDPPPRPLVFVGGSAKEYRSFPRAVLREMGFRLYRVQIGKHAPGEKPLSGGTLKGLGIREIRDDYHRDTYRVVYTVKLERAVYVLHAFKKKSKRGIKTPQTDLILIKRRLRDAEQDHASRFMERKP